MDAEQNPPGAKRMQPVDKVEMTMVFLTMSTGIRKPELRLTKPSSSCFLWIDDQSGTHLDTIWDRITFEGIGNLEHSVNGSCA
jgi:hypothetical protein